MSSYEPFNHRQWGNRLVMNRSLDLWKEYGAETGLFELKKSWNRFLFTRDARDLALIPATIREKANKTFDQSLSRGIELWGSEMYQQYREQRGVSSREMNAWKNAFIEAYSEQIQENLSEIIPDELDGKLDIFCSVVGAIARHLENGGDSEDYGISLGRKIPEVVKTHPDKAAILKRAAREGRHEADLRWSWQTTGSMSIQAPWAPAAYDWKLDRFEEALYEKTYFESYFETLREHLEKFLPKKVWKNAFLICSLYDEMQAQKDRKKKYGSQKGWNYLRSLRESDVWRSNEQRKAAERVYESRAKPTMGIMDPNSRFSSPRISMTMGAKAAFEESGEQPAKYLDRHFSGDFGEITGDDAALNQANMAQDGMVMSIYTLSTGVRFYIITDEGHAMTTLLLPEEY